MGRAAEYLAASFSSQGLWCIPISILLLQASSNSSGTTGKALFNIRFVQHALFNIPIASQ